MLQMRPGCERCDKDLRADAPGACICSFECTFCAQCAEQTFAMVCPNCGGELVARPARAKTLWEQFPPSTERIFKP